MASLHGPSLMEWPAELRLVMYNQLITGCLRHGTASEISGLYLCCRTVHQEIETEYLRTIRPLLVAKHRWETSPCSHLGCLSIIPQSDLQLDPHECDIHVTMPLDTAGAVEEDEDTSTSALSLDCLAIALKPLLTSPWSKVSLRFGLQKDGVPRQTFDPHTFRQLLKRLDTSIFATPPMERLTLQFRNEESRDSSAMSRSMAMAHGVQEWRYISHHRKHAFLNAYLFVLRTGSYRECGFSIDFVPHLKPVEGVKMTIEADDMGEMKLNFC